MKYNVDLNKLEIMFASASLLLIIMCVVFSMFLNRKPDLNYTSESTGGVVSELPVEIESVEVASIKSESIYDAYFTDWDDAEFKELFGTDMLDVCKSNNIDSFLPLMQSWDSYSYNYKFGLIKLGDYLYYSAEDFANNGADPEEVVELFQMLD